MPLIVCTAVCANASAQSAATLYGSIDGGVDYVSNVRGAKQWAVNSGKRSPDRFGFRGTEDIGGGLSAQFRLETGFNSDLGTQAKPTTLFNRYATVGLESRTVGSITLGHMPDFIYENVGSLNNSVPGISSSYSPGNLDGLANIYQIDNAVKYETPNINGFQLGAMNGFGENADNFATGRQYGFGLRYAGGPLRVGAAYTMSHNRTADLRTVFGVTTVLGQALPAGAVFNALTYATSAIGGSYEAGRYIPHATVTEAKLTNAAGSVAARNYEAGVNIDVSGGNKSDILGLSYARSTFQNLAYKQYNLFLSHYFSKRTQLYTGAALQHADGPGAVAGLFGYQPSSGKSQSLFRVGVNQTF